MHEINFLCALSFLKKIMIRSREPFSNAAETCRPDFRVRYTFDRRLECEFQ